MASNREQLPPNHQYPSGWPAAAISAGIQNHLILLSDLNSNTYTNNNNNQTNLNYQITPTLPETLYDDFSHLTLSGFPDPAGHAGAGSFLGNNNNPLLDTPHGGGVGGGFFLRNNNNPPVLDSSAMDIGATNMYLQRMRIESAIKGQMHRQLLGFQGMDTYGYDIHTNNNSNFSLNRFMPTIRPRANLNGFQSNKTYDAFDIDRFEVNPNNLMNLVRTNNNNVISTTQYRWPAQQRQVEVSNSSLEEVRGRIYRLAKDQMGCRFLREKFEGRKPEEIEMIFLEVKDHVRDLMVDQFGNYLIQKFFELCNEEQMNQILRSVISDGRNLLAICLDMHGYVIYWITTLFQM